MSAVLTSLLGLAERSLLVREESEGHTRFRLLEPVRAFAWDRASDEERTDVRDRHLDHFLAFAERMAHGVMGDEQERWLREADAERDNLLVAIAAPRGSDGRVLHLARHLAPYFHRRGAFELGRIQMDSALDRCSGGDPQIRGLVQSALGTFLGLQGRIEDKMAVDRAAMASFEEAGDTYGVLSVVINSATSLFVSGRAHDAHALLAEHIPAIEVCDRPIVQGVGMMLHGTLHEQLGDPELARAYGLRALEIFEESGDHAFRGSALSNLGGIALTAGDLEGASRYFIEAIAIARSNEDVFREAMVTRNLAGVEVAHGRREEARALLDEALAAYRRIGAGRDILETLLHIAEIEPDRDQVTAILREIIGRGDGSAAPECIVARAWLAVAGEGRAAHEELRAVLSDAAGLDPGWRAPVLAAVGVFVASDGDVETAALLAGAIASRARLSPVLADLPAQLRAALEPLRSSSPAEFEELLARGAALSSDDELAFARNALDRAAAGVAP